MGANNYANDDYYTSNVYILHQIRGLCTPIYSRE